MSQVLATSRPPQRTRSCSGTIATVPRGCLQLRP
jgi:hypothetical protein